MIKEIKEKKKLKPCKLCGGKRVGNLTICYSCFIKRERAKKELKIAKFKERKRKKKEKHIWTFKKADTKFSEYIRNRDGKCLRCGKTKFLQNSHFFSRIHYATRYDPDNCITLCYGCHYGNQKGWEYDQAGEYRDFMIARLGVERYNKLVEKHKQFKTKRVALLEVMEFFK